MSTPDAERLAEIQARTDKATPGPWLCGGGDTIGLGIENHSPGSFSYDIELATVSFQRDREHDAQRSRKRGVEVTLGTTEADAQFIAHARQDVPWLLAQVARLQAALKQAKALHQPRDGEQECPRCLASGHYRINETAPCETYRALDGEA